LLYLLKNVIKEEDSTIIFCSTKYHVDFITDTLEFFGIKSVGIYGKMSLMQRRDNFHEFKTGRCKILVVTDLASRGLDVPSVV
jgi:ATP-dependent RNA helicase DDX54/DBP10